MRETRKNKLHRQSEGRKFAGLAFPEGFLPVLLVLDALLESPLILLLLQTLQLSFLLIVELVGALLVLLHRCENVLLAPGRLFVDLGPRGDRLKSGPLLVFVGVTVTNCESFAVVGGKSCVAVGVHFCI